jgi:hypothetical protein
MGRGKFHSPGKNPKHPTQVNRSLIMTSKTAASEYLQFKVQIRTAKEMSLIVNGGHYMTRGHVILCLLYIKMHRMSRNILNPKENRFGYANTPSPKVFRFTFLP